MKYTDFKENRRLASAEASVLAEDEGVLLVIHVLSTEVPQNEARLQTWIKELKWGP